jgi:hypothetical protein
MAMFTLHDKLVSGLRQDGDIEFVFGISVACQWLAAGVVCL